MKREIDEMMYICKRRTDEKHINCIFNLYMESPLLFLVQWESSFMRRVYPPILFQVALSCGIEIWLNESMILVLKNKSVFKLHLLIVILNMYFLFCIFSIVFFFLTPQHSDHHQSQHHYSDEAGEEFGDNGTSPPPTNDAKSLLQFALFNFRESLDKWVSAFFFASFFSNLLPRRAHAHASLHVPPSCIAVHGGCRCPDMSARHLWIRLKSCFGIK